MMPAAKHLDLIFGVDMHVATVPPSPVPAPYIGIVFDPFDYLPFFGSTVTINGLHRAQAGTGGVATPPHLPVPSPFAPPPSNESEVFMGSAIVDLDGDAASHAALPVLSCQTVGIPAPKRPKGSPPKSLVLPTSLVLPIPAGPPVMIGGPPTISLMALGQKAGFAALGKLGKGLRRLQRGSGRVGDAMRAATKKLNNAGDALAKTLKLGDNARNKVKRAICSVTGHPVDVAAGKVFTDRIDLELPGPLAFKWERVWYSTSTYRGPLGHGWHHPYDAGLYVAEDVVLYRAPDGRLVSLPVLEPGAEYFDETEQLTLLYDGQGYAIRTLERTLQRFQDIGREHSEHVLRSISDESGNVVRLNYDKPTRRLVEIVDSAGRSIQLAHDARGRITSMTAPHPDQPGQRLVVMRYGYDAAGNLDQASDALQQAFRYEYRKQLLTRETNRNGLSFHFEYAGADETARCVHTWGDGGIYDHHLSYALDRNLTTVTDSLGQKTQYEHAGGLVVRKIDAHGSSWRTVYDEFNRLVKEVDPLGHSTSFSYDGRGNLSEVLTPDGGALRVRYDAQDRPVEGTDANGGVWRRAYDAQGQLARQTDALGQVTRFSYAGGQVSAVIDPLGNALQLSYDGQKNRAALRGPDGSEQRWEYDVLGRMLSETDPNGNVVQRVYDLLGRPIQIIEPDGNVRKLRYDPEGNLVHVKDEHEEVSYSYQGLHSLCAQSSAGATVRFEYDSEERLTAITNEHGSAFRFELGPTGEVLVEHGFDAVRREYRYDRAGRVTSTVRAGGLVSVYRYDEVDRVRAVEHSDGAHERFAYRRDGELLEAENQTCRVSFERDALGRVLREKRDGHWVASAYDARGLRVRVQSSMGADQRLDRNAVGDVIGLAHADSARNNPFAVSFTRDALGLELERNLPGGVQVRWSRDSLGRPVQNEIDVRRHTLRARSYRWDQGDRLRAVVDARRGPIEYLRDARGRLAQARHADGSVERRFPDAVGDLFRSEDRQDRKFGPAGRLLEANDPSGNVTKYTYDAEGNLLEKTSSDGQCWRYQWGADGMLREVERPDAAKVTFAYDALGRRVRKTFGRRTTCWIWDGDVPLHEWEDGDSAHALDADDASHWADDATLRKSAVIARELDRTAHRRPASGPITWLFEPGTVIPLGKLVGRDAYAIATDHVGAPNALLDEQGAIVWSAEIGIWGELRNLEGDRQACPFRWPGQYEDAETGLYYNRFRYYDPQAGEYVSPDPLGLLGGIQPRSYVDDPVTQADPFGLTSKQLAASMRQQSRAPGAGETAHHIVKERAKGYPAHSRAVLQRQGVGIDSNENGAKLWGSSNSQVATSPHPGRQAARQAGNYHGGAHIHGKENDKLIYRILRSAEKRGVPVDEVLENIGRRMESGNWKKTAQGGCYG